MPLSSINRFSAEKRALEKALGRVTETLLAYTPRHSVRSSGRKPCSYSLGKSISELRTLLKSKTTSLASKT